MDLKSLEHEIKTFKMDEVTFDTVLKFKNLSQKIEDKIKSLLWENFNTNINLLKLSDYQIKIDNKLMDTKEYPTSIIIAIRQKVAAMIKIEQDDSKKAKLKNLKTKLDNLYIQYEDAQDDLQTETNYLYDLIDEKFSWLDEDEEFIEIAELLEKISQEICGKIKSHIKDKHKFYSDYVETLFKLESEQSMSNHNKIYVENYIKTYITNKFGGMFDQICLDVLEANGITEQSTINKFISIYYDHTKQIVKLYFALNEIDARTDMFNQYIESNNSTNSTD
jgi:hypothetical protein